MKLAVLQTRWVTAGTIVAVCLASAGQAQAQRYGRSNRYGHRPSYRKPSYHRPKPYLAPRSVRYPSPRVHRQPRHYHRPSYHTPSYRRADYHRPGYRRADYYRPSYRRADYHRPSYRGHAYRGPRSRWNSRYREPVRVHPVPTHTTYLYPSSRRTACYDPWRPATFYRPVARRPVHRYDPCRTYSPRPQPYYVRSGHSRHHHGGYGFGIGFSRCHHGRGWGFSIGGGHGPHGRGGGLSFYYHR
ncbi:MAG: hypothetical protein JSV78_01320 [Phycisphaerales bacterium]|nr:MAG: hypothetical protein JSV78_01320 [Phycisphaerales bacterium]